MVQISHECPMSLMDIARDEFNDYDYCLVHLLEEHEDYMKFFLQSKEMNRHILLDNSIFELGTAFNPEKFAEWIKRLQPQEYIIPDVLEDCDSTIDNVDHWLSFYNNLPGKKIGVVQGKTYSEIVRCYEFMSANVDKIAISFDYSYYEVTGLGHNKYIKYADGRRNLITKLVKDEIWDLSKPHHLLGAGVPQEFKSYSNAWKTLNIESLDTSNPIQQALLGHKYSEEGLNTKDTTKVADSFNANYTDEQFKRIVYNVDMFQKFCLGEV